MGYELFERSSIRVEEPTISIGASGLLLNAAASRLMREAGARAAWLLYDKAAHKIALKAAPKAESNAYAISFTGQRSGSIRAKAFLAHIGWNAPKRKMLLATWNEKEKMLEVRLPPASPVTKAVRESRREIA